MRSTPLPSFRGSSVAPSTACKDSSSLPAHNPFLASGINGWQIALAVQSAPLPAFRSFSTGGIDLSGTQVSIDPDLELVPSGGFGPGGLPTMGADNISYLGQIDTVTRDFRVVYAIRKDIDPVDYPVDHSTFIYLMDGEWRLRAVIRHDATPEQMAMAVKSLL